MSRINFNNGWKFCQDYKEEMEQPGFNDAEFEEVRLPHTVIETPYNYFDEGIYQKIAIYRKRFSIDEDMTGRKALLTFEAVGHKADVYINGILCETHCGGYTAFTVDITPYLVKDRDNVLAVVCDSRENLNIPPFGKVIDYMTYGGIYREVYLDIRSEDYVEDVYVITEIEPAILKSEITFNFKNNIEASDDYTAEAYLNDKDGNELFSLRAPVKKNVMHLNRRVDNISLWSVDNPVLYSLTIKLLRKDEVLDEKTVQFGFRTAVFKKDGFYLNGKKLRLIGLNRHQSYPYVGYAMPKSVQENDAVILKNELCVNAVRTSHYTQSQHFINKCDELGLLVFTELPGWQYVGDENWKRIACESVSEMVKQYRNHPSIIIWGVRINESGDDDVFYERTNKIAHSLDRSRATGGVRCFKKSHLLEDVYTYNDFSHVGNNPGVIPKSEATSDVEKPYLISEYGGHMYPTKSFDDEEHRLSHAVRHARVINDMLGQDDIAGCFGWCMNDYNTHRDFGSGDRICYHGVMDMFRNPKAAAYVYASQGNKNDVLYVTSSVEIGDHPSCTVGDFYVLTNADSVRLYKNEQMIREYTHADSPFTNMVNPPILINDRVGNLLETNEVLPHETSEALKQLMFAMVDEGGADGNLSASLRLKRNLIMKTSGLTLKDISRMYNTYVGNWGDLATTYRFEAVKDGEVVAVVKKQPMTSADFIVKIDKTKLVEASTYDVASIRMEAVDENGNRLYYCSAPVELSVEGPVEIIGPCVVPFIGGAAGTYVKTTGQSGSGKLTIKSLGKTYSIELDVK